MNDIKGLFNNFERSSTACYDPRECHIFWGVLSDRDIMCMNLTGAKMDIKN